MSNIRGHVVNLQSSVLGGGRKGNKSQAPHFPTATATNTNTNDK
jgi:hypothetical protein